MLGRQPRAPSDDDDHGDDNQDRDNDPSNRHGPTRAIVTVTMRTTPSVVRARVARCYDRSGAPCDVERVGAAIDRQTTWNERDCDGQLRLGTVSSAFDLGQEEA